MLQKNIGFVEIFKYCSVIKLNIEKILKELNNYVFYLDKSYKQKYVPYKILGVNEEIIKLYAQEFSKEFFNLNKERLLFELLRISQNEIYEIKVFYLYLIINLIELSLQNESNWLLSYFCENKSQILSQYKKDYYFLNNLKNEFLNKIESINCEEVYCKV